MRVVVDAHMVGQKETGNETYVLGLLSELANVPDLTIGAVISGSSNSSPLSKLNNLELLPLPSTSNWLRLGYYLPKIFNDWSADILHVTYIAPFFPTFPVVTSVHDVSYRVFPEFFSVRDRLLFATLLPLGFRRSQAILTLSEFSQSEICKEYPYLAGKVHPIPLAAKSLFTKLDGMSISGALLEKFNIKRRFLLAVGNLQPRKNLARLIQAFALVQDETDSQLVVVGKAQWRASQIYELVVSLNLENKVIFTDYVSDDELLHLYNAASLFIYPSLYEGFGLPVLEAMACGTPVIASNTTSIPEVARNAAVLIDPLSVSEIKEAILKVMNTSEYARCLSEKGLINAKEFSWEKTAEATTKVYRSIVN